MLSDIELAQTVLVLTNLLLLLLLQLSRFSRVRLLATPWTPAYQAPPSMGFSRQEYWSRVPLPSPDQPSKVFQIFQVAFTQPCLSGFSFSPSSFE